jgi:protein-S-isoprenylcysteine O-methyltransferase Ste14
MSLPYYVTLGLWFAWWVSWLLAAGWTKKSAAMIPERDEMRHRIFTIAGVVLLFQPFGFPSNIALQLYLPTTTAAWTLNVVILAGFAFCWWARLHLGTLWSANVAAKADHHIVDSGPYGIVRHPIYTGIIVAGLATALERGTAFGFAGAALLAVSFVIKARMEERFLRERLGPEAYDAYKRRVPMLVPFGPRG